MHSLTGEGTSSAALKVMASWFSSNIVAKMIKVEKVADSLPALLTITQSLANKDHQGIVSLKVTRCRSCTF